jgi:tRNA 2-selenouridine synthase
MAATIQHIDPRQFLQLSDHIPMIDVRAPKEYLQGHIPGAISMPLFTDDERAIVGTTYTKTGPEEAMLKGLEIVGPKMKDFVFEAKRLAANNGILVHCWRGGMRSGAMAWLFSFSGIKTSVLTGGYKAYRRYTRESFSEGPVIRILGGMTGSGKTEMLHHLAAMGEQVLDLEGLANHKGSAFGALGQEDQPTNEQFENNLSKKWLSLDPAKPVWIEDESRNIGKVIIPDLLFEKMSRAEMIFLDVTFEERVKRLVAEYGSFGEAELLAIIEKISKRIGGDVAKAAIISLQNADLVKTVSIVLNYYDKTYAYGISKRERNKVLKIHAEGLELMSVARKILLNSKSQAPKYKQIPNTKN